MTHYVVIFATSKRAFDDQVEQHLKDGWELAGGISICIDYKNTLHFAQAMTKVSE